MCSFITSVIDRGLRPETANDREHGIRHLVDIDIPIDFVQEICSFIELDEWGGLLVINIKACFYRLRLIIISLVQFSRTQITRLCFAWWTKKDVVGCLAFPTDASAR